MPLRSWYFLGVFRVSMQAVMVYSGALNRTRQTCQERPVCGLPAGVQSNPEYNLTMMFRINTGKSDLYRAALILGGRVLLGLGLSVVLSMVGLAISWGLFLFSGASSKTTLLIMFMAGAGIGAGIGAYTAWLKLDRHQWSIIALTLLLVVAGGVIGGMGGYQYGANREIECCAEPQTAPFTYTAFGSAIVANAVMYLIAASSAAARMIRSGRKALSG